MALEVTTLVVSLVALGASVWNLVVQIKDRREIDEEVEI